MAEARQPIRPLDRVWYLDSSWRDNSRIVGNWEVDFRLARHPGRIRRRLYETRANHYRYADFPVPILPPFREARFWTSSGSAGAHGLTPAVPTTRPKQVRCDNDYDSGLAQ